MSRLADAALWADYLAQPISALEGCWLDLPCPCSGRVNWYPLRLIRVKRGDMPLAALLPRLRCQECRQPPARAWLTNSPQSFAKGGGGPSPSDWRDELPMPDSAGQETESRLAAR